jgi:hypothetical protein
MRFRSSRRASIYLIDPPVREVRDVEEMEIDKNPSQVRNFRLDCLTADLLNGYPRTIAGSSFVASNASADAGSAKNHERDPESPERLIESHLSETQSLSAQERLVQTNLSLQ